MKRTPTEVALQDWRFGQTQAERMCSELLHIEGYQDVDPQCPLGGPDGLKDALCERNGKKWIAACYFPTTRAEFKHIRKKFKHDLQGAQRNKTRGFVFFVNQPLTLGNRTDLSAIAQPRTVELYHLERIRALLDSPKGYGIRLEYLRIPMIEEEQIGFWSAQKDELSCKFLRQEAALLALHRKMDTLLERTWSLVTNLVDQPSSLITNDLQSANLINFPTASISLGQIRWIHNLVMDDTRFPYQNRGRFRTVAVWVGKGGEPPTKARFTPPPPDKILPLTEKLLSGWRKAYPKLIRARPDVVVSALAKFHHGFLSIHPFLDGNGRVARGILQQQALELLNRRITAKFTSDPRCYYNALSTADKGNLKTLSQLIRSCLE